MTTDVHAQKTIGAAPRQRHPDPVTQLIDPAAVVRFPVPPGRVGTTTVPGHPRQRQPRVDDTPLRHGYTLAHLHDMAKHAVHITGTMGLDWHDRYDTAWSAIAEAIYAAETKPSRFALVQVGQVALHDVADDHMQAYGYYRRKTDGHQHGPFSSPAFRVYWWDILSSMRTQSAERRIVERAALVQILPTLTEAQRDAIVALAVHGDYQAAADSLGISYSTLKTTLARGRRRFRALWHEGEVPSKPWGTDRRIGSYEAGKQGGRRSQTSILADRRRRAQTVRKDAA